MAHTLFSSFGTRDTAKEAMSAAYFRLPRLGAPVEEVPTDDCRFGGHLLTDTDRMAPPVKHWTTSLSPARVAGTAANNIVAVAENICKMPLAAVEGLATGVALAAKPQRAELSPSFLGRAGGFAVAFLGGVAGAFGYGVRAVANVVEVVGNVGEFAFKGVAWLTSKDARNKWSK